MKITAIDAGWLIKEGKGYIGPALENPRKVRFTHVNGKSIDWTFPSPRVARQFIGLVVRAPAHTPRPEHLS